MYCRNWWEADYYNYRADWQAQETPYGLTEPPKWRPSIHMPKEAARIFLRVKRVRVERLQEITADECPMEGTPLFSGLVGDRERFYKEAFAKVWDSTIPRHPNKFKSYPYYWKDNPWVWVNEFERISKEEALK